jgi:LuxR family maltose regulon positive regulatory protein
VILAPVVETKLSPPAPRPGLIDRDGLVARLLEPRPLSVISAPAGYGKTMLLAQYVAAVERPVAWVSVDAADLDPVVLVTEIATALDRITPIDPLVFRNLLTPHPAIEAEVLPRLLNSLALGEESVLILDDLHRAGTGPSQAVVAFLCEHLPANARLILAAREAPALPLGRLRAHRSLLEFGPSDLALTRAEARQLVERAQVTLDAEAFNLLYERTEGWAAGIYLAALAAGGTTDPSRAVRQFGGDDRTVFDYLAGELLASLPVASLSFLLRTSVLSRFSASLCDAVLERTDSQALLAELERTNRFLVPLDRRREWYRYHHLFGEVLRTSLARFEPELVPDLHDRASRWHELNGTTAEAIEHALASRNRRRAAELVGRNLRVLFNSGQQTTIRGWLKSFSDADLEAFPPLAVGGAWAMAQLGERDLARRYVELLERMPSFDGPFLFDESSTRAAAALLRALLATDGINTMTQQAELAARLEPPGNAGHQLAATCLGANLYLRGQPVAAQRMLEEAYVLRDVGPLRALFALSMLALLHLEANRLGEAEDVVREGLVLADERGLNGYFASAGLLGVGAWLDLEHGDDEAARTHLDTLVSLLPRSAALPWLSIRLAVLAAQVALALHDLARGESLLRQARHELAAYPDAGVLPNLVVTTERELEALRAGAGTLHEPLTEAELRVLELLPTHLTVDEIGRRLNLSRNTVKTHLRGIYGKLSVSSRGEAVAQARALHRIGRRSSSH